MCISSSNKQNSFYLGEKATVEILVRAETSNRTERKKQGPRMFFVMCLISSPPVISCPTPIRLLHLLPSDNLLLLRHVIAVLHCIQGSADDNQMNAFNLSVCIAPSMLWSPAPSTPEMEGEATKKVRRDRPMDTLEQG